MVRMRWQGFLTPQFVQRIVDTATYVGSLPYAIEAQNSRRTLLPRRRATHPNAPMIGLTIHGSTGVPILTHPRVPRLKGEDTVCIMLAHEGTDDEEMGLNGE